MRLQTVLQNAIGAVVLGVAALFFGCSSAPTVKKGSEAFKLLPAGVMFDEGGGRPYQEVGTVRAWQEFKTELDESFDEKEFQRRCKLAFHGAAEKVLQIAREHGGDAVVRVRSVVFLADGRKEYLPSAECADDGDEGEALVEGMAIRWKGPVPLAAPAATAAAPAAPAPQRRIIPIKRAAPKEGDPSTSP